MRYFALAADYGGTLASSGVVAESTLGAIEQLIASGRRFLIVTGRVLPDLLEVFPQVSRCERVVAENGADLYRPATNEIRLLAPPPLPAFVEELRRRKVTPLHVGQTIIATCSLYENVILEVIRHFGLVPDFHLVFCSRFSSRFRIESTSNQSRATWLKNLKLIVHIGNHSGNPCDAFAISTHQVDANCFSFPLHD